MHLRHGTTMPRTAFCSVAVLVLLLATAQMMVGAANTETGSFATVGGGDRNVASGGYATIGGGRDNLASAIVDATIGGGEKNTASAKDATVAGGESNEVTGNYGFVGGGRFNTVTQWDSAALGFRASATHEDSLVLGFNDAACTSRGVKTVSICASGGLYLNGVKMSAGESTGGGGAVLTSVDTSSQLTIADGGAAQYVLPNAAGTVGQVLKAGSTPATLEWGDGLKGNDGKDGKDCNTTQLQALQERIATLEGRRNEANTLNPEESASSDLTATTSFPLMLCLPAGMFMSLLFLDK